MAHGCCNMNKATIVYDGSCSFCIEQIGRIRHMDRSSHFDYLSSHDSQLSSRFPFLKEMNLEEGMRLVTGKNEVYVCADAVYEIAKHLPGPNLIAWLYLLPGCKQVARQIYSWIAANRKRLGKTCENQLCKTK